MPKGLTAVLLQPGRPLALESSPRPGGAGRLFVKNTAAAICGSDLHYWRNDGNYSGPDIRRVPGHEFTGVMAALGKGVRRTPAPSPQGRRPHRVSLLQPVNRCYWCVQGRHQASGDRQRKQYQFYV